MDSLKTSELDTERQALLLSPYLTAYLNRRDNALGFIQPGFMTRESVSYHYAQQAEAEQKVTRTASKVIKLRIIQAQISVIIQEAKTATPERQKELLAQAKKLRRQARNPHTPTGVPKREGMRSAYG